MAAHVDRIAADGFRCLDGFSVELGKLTALIGANGAGKSSVLRALQFVFGELDLDPADCTDGETAREVHVEIRIVEIPDVWLERLRPWLDSEDRLTVARYRVQTEDGQVRHFWTATRKQCPGFAQVRDALRTGVPAEELKTLWAAADAMVDSKLGKWTSKAAAPTRLDKFEDDHPELRTKHEPDSSLRFGPGGTHDLSTLIELLVLPAMRDAAFDADDGKGSTLGRLVELTVRAGMGLDERLAELTEKTAAEYDKIVQEASGDRLTELARDVTEQLGSFAPGAQVQLEWAQPRRAPLSAPPVRAQIVESGHAADVGRQGHGVQRAYVFSLLRTLLDARRAQSADRPGLLLAIEEPEAYQHPLRARYVSRVLSRLASDISAATQVLYTTHSPYLVSVDALATIRILRMTPVATTEEESPQDAPGGPTEVTGTGRSRPAEVEDGALPLNFDAAPSDLGVPDPARTRVDVSRTKPTTPSLAEIAQRLDEARDGAGKPWTSERVAAQLPGLMGIALSEGFFADAVALVEGAEDVGILQGAADALDLELAENGVALIAVDGKSQLPLAMETFRAAGLPVYAVFDTDEDKSDQGALQQNAYIATLAGGPPDRRPGTRVEHAFASVSPTLRAVLDSEIGVDVVKGVFDETAASMGLSARQEKNGHLARVAVRTLLENGHHSPTLTRLVRVLHALGD